MRLFVAVEPSPTVRSAAFACGARLRDRLRRADADHGIRWVPEQNLHLTLWFLGEVSDARSAAVLDALQAPVAIQPFDLHLAGAGAFPPSGDPRVLWMGVARGTEQLSRAHDEIGARLVPWGFAAEGRPYSAHLTLARVKEPPHGAARTAIRDILRDEAADSGVCRVTALTVFRSRPAPAGAVYERVLRVPLK